MKGHQEVKSSTRSFRDGSDGAEEAEEVSGAWHHERVSDHLLLVRSEECADEGEGLGKRGGGGGTGLGKRVGTEGTKGKRGEGGRTNKEDGGSGASAEGIKEKRTGGERRRTGQGERGAEGKSEDRSAERGTKATDLVMRFLWTTTSSSTYSNSANEGKRAVG